MSGGNDIWDDARDVIGFLEGGAGRKSLRSPTWAAILLTVIFVATVALPSNKIVLPHNYFLPLHTVLELFSILVSVMIFTLTWSLRWQGENSRRVIISAGFLAVCLIDMMHAFSYEGMPDFISPSSAEKAIFFWLVARYVTAATLLAIALMRTVRWSAVTCYAVLGGAVAFSIGVWLAGTFYLDRLPRMFVEGQGLTSFKIWAEYLVAILYAVASLLLGITGWQTNNVRRCWVSASAWCLVLSEVYFTLYANVTDFSNVYGHVFKAIAFAMLFRAAFVSGVREPYLQLERERSWLEALLASLPDPIWLKTPAGVYLSCNNAFEALCGRPPDKVIGGTDYDIFDKEHADLFRANDLLALKGGGVNVNEEWIDTANAGNRLFETSKMAVRLSGGAVLGVLGIAHDITDQRTAAERLQKLAGELERENAERRQAETKLVAANAMYDAVIRGMPIALMVVDPDGAVTTWNEAARKTFGYTEKQLLGAAGRMVFAESSRSVFDAAFQDALAGRSKAALEVNCLQGSGAEFPALLYRAVVRSAGGAVRAVIFAIEDVSERRSIEAQLRQSQKMEAVGQLTAGIAHDFNNILAIIVGNLELLLEEEEKTPSCEILARGALNASLRGAALTERLLAYSRQQTLEPTVIDIAELLRSEEQLMRRSLEEFIGLEFIIEEPLWCVRVDVTRLQDSLLNLALNARDSMPTGGKLTFAAKNVVLDDDYTSRHLDVAPGEYVKLSIIDTGIGMSQETLEQVLEPFFTTKPMGQGSGLGLSMVYGFVKQSGGHMEIESALGEGTTINLYLPRTLEGAAPMPATKTEEKEPTAPAAGEAVLLVEDDKDVRDMIVGYLDKLGYRVVETCDGREALDALKSGQAFDMIITDVVLPGGMRGPDIVAAAAEVAPGLKTLYISGYSENALSQEGELIEGVHLLSKPFRMKDLANKLRELLDA